MKNSVCIFDYRTGTEYLNAVYRSIAEKNSRYSLRSFAQKIDLDQSTLVRYFSKERFLSSDKCNIVAQRLKLTEIETHYFKLLTLFGDRGEFAILEKMRLAFLFQVSANKDETTQKVFASSANFLTEPAVARSSLNNFENSDVEIYTSTIAMKTEGRTKLLQAVQNLHGVISEYMAEEGADDTFLVNLSNPKTHSPSAR
jgi:transcriptional regulator with XRE-family HTH domain